MSESSQPQAARQPGAPQAPPPAPHQAQPTSQSAAPRAIPKFADDPGETAHLTRRPKR